MIEKVEKKAGKKETEKKADNFKGIIMNYHLGYCKGLEVFVAVLLPLLCLQFVPNAAYRLNTIPFDEAYSPLFGDSNLVRSPDGGGVRLLLDRFTGSGFISSKMYKYGFFSANIKLPSNYSAGIVVAFYTSNGDVFIKNHDELDLEFLGNIEGKPWRIQTNLYGNGSTTRGREERYRLWFDPSKEFHRYSILWTQNNVIFYIDEVPVREVVRNEEMGGDYPSKPMALYATIWDASTWATGGGKYKVNYKFAPFVSEFKDLVLDGCITDPIEPTSETSACSDAEALLDVQDLTVISPERRAAMRKFREKYMYYSFCYDLLRYPTPLPECDIIPSEQRLFKETGRLKFGNNPRRRRTRRRGHPSEYDDSDEQPGDDE